MLGSFHQLSDPLFFRREHRGSSVRANPDVEARNQWFDPSARGSSEFIRWKWVGEYLKGIRHVPIGPAEQARCTWELHDFVVRQRSWLLAEIKRPLKRTLVRFGIRKEPRP